MKRQAICVVPVVLITALVTGCHSDPMALTPASMRSAAELSGTALPAGTWIPRGNLNVPRFGPTATLLPNGTVLLAGGGNNLGALSSSESFSPATAAWTTTGSMNTARTGFSATLLPNGQVLVAGGSDNVSALASAELYDPATGIWTSTGTMGTARESYTATLLLNGKVLVVGGGDRTCRTGCGPYATAELYDPASGTWSPAASMGSPRLNHRAILLRSGKVLVTGGNDGRCSPSSCGLSVWASTELYDPITGTWSPTGSMGIGRAAHTLTRLQDGRVLVVGGGKNNNSDCVALAELYDPSIGSWSVTGSMTAARCGHTASLLQNGSVLIAGGGSSSTPPLASAELYDSRSGAWVTVATMGHPRWAHAATVLPGGGVLVAAGGGGGMGRSELYTIVDFTPPVIVPSVNGTLGANGWHVSDVTVSFTVSDPESAPTLTGCDNSTASSDTPGITFLCSATSAGGSASRSVTIKRDATKPEIAYADNAGSYTVDQAVAITCSASDATSKLYSTTCADVSGPAYSFNLGGNSYSSTATDFAGNRNSASATFTVAVSTASLCTLVQRFVTSAGVANSMCAKLDHGSYDAFRHELSAQSGKKMTETHAAILRRLVDSLDQP